MGKSTTARLFAEEGIPVHDADDAVHRLYRGKAVPLIEKAFPGTAEAGVVNRAKLAENLAKNPDKFRVLEALIHPLVRVEEAEFLSLQKDAGADIVLLDIPLLFETGAEARVDKIVVVSCDPALQRERVLARPGMTQEKFEMILARQTPDAEKRRQADFVVDTGHGIEDARRQVRKILAVLRAPE
ncbi:dephospho-CoA kinase [Pseudomonas sp. R2.Fl]|nr:dephospho-CoA kinase [Pseudomonas sp. R2.Fl]